MKTFTYKFMAVCGVAATLTMAYGCVDSNYDLSDIDTSVELTVDHLTLPVNIDRIKLSSIISLSDDSRIKVVGGEYVLTEEGTFNSEPIKVASFTAPSTGVNPIDEQFTLTSANKSVSRASAATFTVGGYYSTFDYKATGVDSHVADITSAEVALTMQVNLAIKATGLKGYRFNSLELQYPKGLVATTSVGSYDAKTGLLTITDVTPASGTLSVDLVVTGIDLSTDEANFDGERHEFAFAGSVGVKEASIEVTEVTGVITSGTLHVDFGFSDVEIKSVSGVIDYSIDGLSISPISLDNLPDFLSQSSTDIIIDNPQIYLGITNPLNEYGLSAEAGLSITPVRDGKDGTCASLDNGVFTIKAVDTEQHYCMSPQKPSSFTSGYSDAEYVPYTALSRVLEGSGLPQQLKVDISGARVPRQSVKNFRLGSEIGSVQGSYNLLAPLALDEGSVIVYSRTENGWNDDTIDKLTISSLEVSFTASTDVPLGVTLTGYPIDINGNRINDVEIEGATLSPNADNQAVTLRFTGEIKHLDGVTFEATTVSPKNASSLSPNQNIELRNIRATVSGRYDDKL